MKLGSLLNYVYFNRRAGEIRLGYLDLPHNDRFPSEPETFYLKAPHGFIEVAVPTMTLPTEKKTVILYTLTNPFYYNANPYYAPIIQKEAAGVAKYAERWESKGYNVKVIRPLNSTEIPSHITWMTHPMVEKVIVIGYGGVYEKKR